MSLVKYSTEKQLKDAGYQKPAPGSLSFEDCLMSDGLLKQMGLNPLKYAEAEKGFRYVTIIKVLIDEYRKEGSEKIWPKDTCWYVPTR